MIHIQRLYSYNSSLYRPRSGPHQGRYTRGTVVNAFQNQPKPPPLRKFHTIHLRDTKSPFVFHVYENRDEPCKSYIVSFKDIDMAKQMVHIIRTHYAVHGEWPNTHLYPGEPLAIVLPENDEITPITLDTLEKVPKIWIRTWSEPELEKFCSHSFLHIFQINDNHTVELLRFEYNINSLKAYLNRQWK